MAKKTESSAKESPVKKSISGKGKMVRPEQLTDKSIESDLNKLEAKVNRLLVQKQKDKKPFKHLLIVRNRLRLLIAMWNRTMRTGGVKA